VSDEEQQQQPTEAHQAVQQAMPTDTGHPAVDSTLASLAGIVDLPARDQVAAYGDVHRTLQDTLATIDER
jgi:hypothetical protein